MNALTTAGKGEEMLNILVNDTSFSTNKSGKRSVKKGKKGKKGEVGHSKAKEMGFSAMEILQMRDAEK